VIGLSREGIREYVPEVLQDVAFRLLDLGYEVNYRKVPPRPKKSRRVWREVVDAENDNFTHLRMTVIWALTRGPLLVLQGSSRDIEGEQLKFIPLDAVDDFWNFAESNGRCPCGGKVLTERSARAIVTRARKGGVADADMYACSGWPQFFHVTANPYPKVLRS